MGHLADNLGKLAGVPSRVSGRIAGEIAELIEEEFAVGTDPYGRAWAPLAQATIDKGREPPPLTETGTMRQSVNVRPMRGAGVAITIDHPAAPHQTGWSGPRGEGPARPVLPDRQELPATYRAAIETAIDEEIREVTR
jgi:hypothetical protein